MFWQQNICIKRICKVLDNISNELIKLKTGKVLELPKDIEKSFDSINSCEVIEGDLPKKQLRLVLAWAELHQDELKANWKLAMDSELPVKMEPLK